MTISGGRGIPVLDFAVAPIEDEEVNGKLTHPWPERNKQPILKVFERVLPTRGAVLEIASGSGQHAVYFAENLPTIRWIPSDIDPKNLDSIRAWRDEAALRNLLEPRIIDVLDRDWDINPVEVVFNANLIHIAPWECCLSLLAGARRHLVPNGLLILYGPFQIGGEHTARSNADFDESLRSRDPSWGVRDLEVVQDAADGFALEERVEMPANNQILVFQRT